MELPDDWKKLVDEFGGYGRGIVERCYALTQKPPKELTDAELDAEHTAWLDEDEDGGWRPLMRRAIAAHIAKQREPEVVKFRAAQTEGRDDVMVFHSDVALPPNWKWLDYEGKPQVFEVRV